MASTKRRYQIHNCHTHLFTMDHVPEYFLSRFFRTSWAKKKWIARLGTLLAGRMIDRYAAFFYSSMKVTQADVLRELRGYYPRNAKFCVLSVDFEYMNAGKCRLGFIEQIDELALLARTVNEEEGEDIVIPFLGIDPRRPNLPDLVREYVEDRGFRGFKMYPALGFFPNDERLYPVYEYAQQYQLPITTHCLPKNKNHFRFKPTKEMIAQARQVKGCEEWELRKPYDFAKYLNHPHWYQVLLEDFPELKLNFGHFGGNEEWDKYLDTPDEKFEKDISWYSLIRGMIKRYPNVYADISFTVFDRNLYPLLKNLVNSEYKNSAFYSPKEKVLFGTDFYMLQKDYRERRFGIDLRGYLSDEEYWQIAEDNPRRFLANQLD
jgi:predicted TIM-barrel fold metal-dependent hydrolase